MIGVCLVTVASAAIGLIDVVFACLRASCRWPHGGFVPARAPIHLRRWFVLALTLTWGASLPPLRAAEKESGDRTIAANDQDALRDVVETLANDIFEGRAAGSRGGHAAAYYLLTKFQNFDLLPMGDRRQGYYQAFGNQCQNILGLLPGSDPTVKDQVVMVCAHFDHVGYGNKSNSRGGIGEIHNGADDNASGVAVLLEVIKAFQSLPSAPRRSILFALWDGEEEELRGSRYWTAHPTTPLNQVTFVCNLDMVGRLGDKKLEVIGWRSQAGLRRLVVEQNDHATLPLDFCWKLKKNSDHYSFYQFDIPVLMFHTGLHDDYHRPSDDADKLDYAGMAKITRLVADTIRAVADLPQVPAFRTSVHTETSALRGAIESPVAAPPGRLGIEWKYSRDNDRLLITRVNANSAAERAGLCQGDTLLSVDGNQLGEGVDLDSLIVMAPPSIDVVVQRADDSASELRTVDLHGEPVRIGISWRVDPADPTAIILVQVVPYSPADRAGLRLTDRIYRVDGLGFLNDEEFQQLIERRSLPLELQFERDGVTHVVKLDAPTRNVSVKATARARH
ncbi:MAG: M28 family peptidase [Planctomycetes bacterium]|nr:M28 family peptidase [Planctomycetota bacterium]